MIVEAVISGIMLGSVSSLHCVGMCGPMALTFGTTVKRIALYHSGRITTYMMLGLIAGLMGHRIYIAGLQQIVSISLGILIIAGLVLTRRRGNTLISKPIYRLQSWAMSQSRTFVVGMANGLLPCGMVYLALAAALGAASQPTHIGAASLTSGISSTSLPSGSSFASLTSGISLMAAFGLGTLPPLLILHWSRNFISMSTRIRLRRAIPFFIGVMGLLLILRGCNLGIPFLSPALPTIPNAAISCH